MLTTRSIQSRSKTLYCGFPKWGLPQTKQNSIINVINYSWHDLMDHITTPLQRTIAHRARDMAGIQLYWPLFFLYKNNWNYFPHVSAWFRLNFIWEYNNKAYCINTTFYDLGHISETHYLSCLVTRQRQDLGHKMFYLYNNLQKYLHADHCRIFWMLNLNQIYLSYFTLKIDQHLN